MKKLSSLYCVLTALALAGATFTFTGCGKSKAKGSKPGSAQAASASADKDDEDDAEEEEAGAGEGQSTIAFYNSFLPFRGVSQSVFEKVGKALEAGDTFIGRDIRSEQPDWAGIVDRTSNITKIPGYKFSAPGDFSKENKEYINTRIEIVKKDVAALLKEIEAMKEYYKSEDYKDDWHKKFLMAKPRIEGLMEEIAKNNKEVFKLADKLSEDVDRKNIAKAPDGVFILNMRYMIDKAKERADLIFDNNFEDTRYGCGVSDEEHVQMVAKAVGICDKFDAITKELDAMCAKYKAADKGVIKGSPAEKIYDGFFTSYENSSTDMRRIIRELRERGYTNDQNTVGNKVGDLVSAHNAFLKSRSGK